MAALFTEIRLVVTEFLALMGQVITFMTAQPLVMLFVGILILGLVFRYVRSIISGL